MINVIFIILLLFLRYFIFFTRIMILISFHPIFIGVLILFFCLIISVFLSIFSYSWLSFLLFYLIRGGILILLIYISCYSFNPIFKKRFIGILIMLFCVFLILKKNFFIFKKRYRLLMLPETGRNLRQIFNIRILLLVSFFIFLCFLQVSSEGFSIEELYLV